ncbi:MAG: hypothetical protein AAB953_00585 [Patescibacteria group bacterium]
MLSLTDQNLLLERYARGKESNLIERYIKDGQTALREEFGLSEEEWTVIFDYLIFDHNLLYKAVMQASDFFVENYVKHGMTHVREILNINDTKYDVIWEVVFDFLAISNEGLYYHVLEHRDRYMIAFKARGGDFVRKVLGIWKEKYEEHWAKILDLLLYSICNEFISDQNFEHGLRAFSYLMNGMRENRPVEKSEIARKFL